jgi:bifunctional non-homologous end joining protein LigD
MLQKGDLKFRLNGQKLKGEFALVHMKSRRPGTKGTEWLLIKHRDAYAQTGYDIDQFDYSVLTKRTIDEIAGDAGSAEWKSSRKVSAAGRSAKNDWLADSIAQADAKRAKVAKKSLAEANPSDEPHLSKGDLSGTSISRSSVSAIKKKLRAKPRVRP